MLRFWPAGSDFEKMASKSTTFLIRHRRKLVALATFGGAGVAVYYLVKALRSRIERYVMQQIQSGLLGMGGSRRAKRA